MGKRSSQVKGFKGSKGTPCMAGLEIGDEITHVNDLRFMNWHPGLVRTGGLGQWVQGWSAPIVVGGSEKVVLQVDDVSFSVSVGGPEVSDPASDSGDAGATQSWGKNLWFPPMKNRFSISCAGIGS